MSAYLESEVSLAKAEERAAEEARRVAQARVEAAARARRAAEERLEESARLNPAVGDRWTEMYSTWCYVIDVTETFVTIQWQGAPYTFPADAIKKTMTREEWGKDTNHPTLAGRGHDVAGWKGKAREVR